MYQPIRSLHPDDKPRERLVNFGAKVLSNAELLAILLRTGTKDKSAIGLASEVLSTMGGIGGLKRTEIAELESIKGIGESKACQIMASFELARRINGANPKSNYTFTSPKDVFNYVISELKFEEREHFYIIGLNTKNRLIGKHLVSIGTLNQTIVHPREVFNWAIKLKCASVVLVHNHPSGSTEPSKEDLFLTKRIVEAGHIIGIGVVDHLIVTQDDFYSFKSHGKI